MNNTFMQLWAMAGRNRHQRANEKCLSKNGAATSASTHSSVVRKQNPCGGRRCARKRPLAPSLLLKRLLQNGDLAVAGGENIEFAGSFQGIRIKEDNSVLFAVRRRNAQLRTKLAECRVGRPQTVLASQSERTGFAIDGSDLPEGGAAVNERIIVDDGADDAGVVEDDGSVGSGGEAGVGGSAGQTLGVALGIAAVHSSGEEVANGRDKARAGSGCGSSGEGGRRRRRRGRDDEGAEGEGAGSAEEKRQEARAQQHQPQHPHGATRERDSHLMYQGVFREVQCRALSAP